MSEFVRRAPEIAVAVAGKSHTDAVPTLGHLDDRIGIARGIGGVHPIEGSGGVTQDVALDIIDPRRRRAVAAPLPGGRHALVMPLPSRGHAAAMPLRCICHAGATHL